MKQEDTIKIIHRLLEQIDLNASELSSEEKIVSTSAFTDSTIFEKEKTLFFYQQPQVIGFSAEVAKPNSFYTTESMGKPLLVTRDEIGKLRAFINACPHRGAKVAEGTGMLGQNGQQKRLVCPFHGWAFNLNGKLNGRPGSQFFTSEGEQCQLTQLPVTDKYGLLVVGLDSSIQQQDVDDYLDSIGYEIEDFKLNELHSHPSHEVNVKANWKLVAHMSHESYHFSNLHKDSVAQYLHSNAVYDTFGKHSRWAFAMRGLEQLKNEPKSKWPRFLDGAMNHTLFPGTVLVSNPEDAQLIRVEPGEKPGESKVYFSGVYRDLNNKEGADFAYDFGFTVFSQEDLPVAEQCQKGFAAGQKTMIIGKNEPIVAFWQTLWEQQLAEMEAHTNKQLLSL